MIRRTPPSVGCPAHEAVVARLRAAGCVFAEDEAGLLIDHARDAPQLAAAVQRRVDGEPLEYILGWALFRDRRIAVLPGVFVPRRRTGLLVDLAVALIRPGGVVVDLCCGSGAIGSAVAAAVPGVEIHAADVDAAAVRCAAINLADCGGQVHRGDLYAALPGGLRGRVDVLLVNAPYVPTDAIAFMPPEARLYEPRAAYDGGADGLDVQRRVAKDAAAWLSPGGRLIVETSSGQADESARLIARAGLHTHIATDDEIAATAVAGWRRR